MKLSEMNHLHLTAMVQCMYKWSAQLHHEPYLPTTAQEMDFYMAHLGGGQI